MTSGVVCRQKRCRGANDPRGHLQTEVICRQRLFAQNFSGGTFNGGTREC